MTITLAKPTDRTGYALPGTPVYVAVIDNVPAVYMTAGGALATYMREGYTPTTDLGEALSLSDAMGQLLTYGYVWLGTDNAAIHREYVA
jgi:hypothetical protein